MDYLLLILAIAGIVLISIEFLFPGFFVFFSRSGVLVTAPLAALIPGLRGDPAAQILIWIGS